MRRILRSWQALSILTWLARLLPIVCFCGSAFVGLFVLHPQGKDFAGILLLAIGFMIARFLYAHPRFDKFCERNSARWIELRRTGALPSCECGADAWLGQRHLKRGCPHVRRRMSPEAPRSTS